ncbi:MAG: PEGA domain-containing protein [Ignavibacteriae bacterium]|nr:PEGA domain-containing protein [Ignavibacteriota bacterium]
MKKISLILLALLISITFISCDETATDPVDETGTIFVDSNPQGAEIWLDDVNTNKFTPATITADEGVRTVTLKLEGFEDLTITVSVESGNESIVSSNTLVALSVYFSTPVRIWETYNTPVTLPSGLDLSTGFAYGTSDEMNRGNIDLYYYSSVDGNWLVQSSHLNTNMSRETFFKAGFHADLEDGVSSTVKTVNWDNNMSDEETNYVFIYDADGHYSKLKIFDSGGDGTSDDPAWVEVVWVYNSVQDDPTF